MRRQLTILRTVIGVFRHYIHDEPKVKRVKVVKRQAYLQRPQNEKRRVQLSLCRSDFFLGFDCCLVMSTHTPRISGAFCNREVMSNCSSHAT